jgi:hypothetical protein
MKIMERINQMLSMEKQAGEFYRACIVSFKDMGLIKIFTTLVNISKNNEDLIKESILQGVQYDTDERSGDGNIFMCLDDCGCAHIHKEEIGTYIAGSEMERKIIDEYADIKGKAVEKRMTEIINHLLEKHRNALFVLDDMIEMLNRNADWVESAEFTIREPY